MLSKIRKNLYDADDAKFSQEISTPEGRLKKLQTLRDARLNSIYIFLPGMFLLIIQIIQFWGAKNTDASDVILVVASLPMIIGGSVTYFSFDSQIKMLLLFEQTQPKG